MRSWSSVQVPALSDRGLGHGPGIQIYDVAQKRVIDADPDGLARMYVCGITPYDATHLGHAATYVAFDLIVRLWRDRGIDVNYTQNVTDIDDPLLERARVDGVDWHELAQSQTELFRQDMRSLRVIPPDHFIGAVETVDLVIGLIEKLQAAGAVYRVDEDLYFRVRHDSEFGSVSGFDTAAMLEVFADRGGDPERPGKDDPFDCLVWKAEVAGEPAWDSPFGRGRPGWHIECAAIALEHLGANFDIQGGGSDLAFPHHEMSAAQGRVGTGEEFAKSYVHSGMVAFHGEKMSKSKGNLELVSRLRDRGADPMAIRLAILAQHYRSDWEWVDTSLTHGQDRLERWRVAVARPAAGPAQATVDEIRAALSDDLDTARALRAIDAWAQAPGSDADAPGHLAAAIDALLGVDVIH